MFRPRTVDSNPQPAPVYGRRPSATSLALFMRSLAVLVLPLLLTACQTVAPSDPSGTVLAIDFMRTLPGEQADYLRFVDLNWRPARAAAQDEGHVARFEVLVRPPQDGEDWDVMLVTEYANETAYANREAIFADLFARPELAMKPIDGKGPRDMATFVGESAVVRRVVAH